jgi:hypothetical protein
VQYLDFDLEVSAGDAGTYTVKVLRSPAGEATGTMRMPFSDLALQNNLQALQIALLRSGSTRRRVDTPESQTVQKFGQALWQALFNGDVLGRFEASRGEARREDAGMRIKLRIEAPELATLPWEYLFDTDRGDYVSLSASTPVVRYIPLPEAMTPLLVKPPLRILGMIVSPSDLPALDVDRERQRLDTALGDLIRRGLVELTWMPGGTSRDLQQALWKGPWHVFHFIGHGGFDEIRGEGLVILNDEAGKAQRVSATDLGRLLGDHDPLRLAVLNACESARGDQLDVFSSTAATLVRRGTPAVVAMQYEITDTAAIEFSRSFYEAVASGIAVDASLAEARKGVALAIPGTLEWGTPVLYMRAPDGVLFDIPEVPVEAAPPPPSPVDEPPAPAVIEPRPPLVVEPPPAPIAEVAPQPSPVSPMAEPPEAVVTPPVEVPSRATDPSPAPIIQPVPAAMPAVVPAATVLPVATIPAVVTPGGWQAPARSMNDRTRRVLITLVALLGFLIVFFASLGALASRPDGGGATDEPTPFDSIAAVDPGASAGVVRGGVLDDIHSGILFTNDSGANQEIYRVAPGGGEPVAVTSDAVDDRWPSWSPDGSQIAYTVVSGGQGDIYVMDADGGNQRQLTSGDDNDWAPTWSPDGLFLAFNSDRNESDKTMNDIWIVPIDGSAPTILAGEPGHDERSPDWSPIGSLIAFSSDRDGEGRSVYTVQPDGQDPQRVTSGAWTDRNPTWGPDGAILIFSRAPASAPSLRDIWSVRLDGSGPVALSLDPADEGNPVFSPDGTAIAFYRKVGDDFHLFVGDNVSTRDVTPSLAGNSLDPSWR